MINILVAFDDNDTQLGDYFELSFDDLSNNLPKENITLISIRGLECSEQNVLDRINSFEEENFGFVGLSHGNDWQLLTDNDVYVDIDNVLHFKNSLFYSTACSIGIKLGQELINQECKCFVGFNDETYATYEHFHDIYIECENYCLRDFFSNESTIKESFDKMLAHFDTKILELENQNEILVAMELIGNKDSFVIYGDSTLTKFDLE